MKIDTFVQLIKNLSTNSIDDTDPSNTILQEYTTPFDTVSVDDSVRALKSSNYVWGDGTTYTAYDSNNQQYQAPSCGWLWSVGGIWGGASSTITWLSYQNYTNNSLANSTWDSLAGNETWSSLGSVQWSAMGSDEWSTL